MPVGSPRFRLARDQMLHDTTGLPKVRWAILLVTFLETELWEG
jgi:hypothetical protein